MNVGQRIRKRRVDMKLTQRQLAQVLKVTPQHISALEQDKRTPSLASLAKLAEELGVTVDYLVTGREGVIRDTIPTIKADKRLKLGDKKALITLIQSLYGENEETR
jgi:transcriptional regulator with XRE-family HTH domain